MQAQEGDATHTQVQGALQQLRRPAFSRVSELGIRYLPYGQLTAHGPAIKRFGAGLKPLMEISEAL